MLTDETHPVQTPCCHKGGKASTLVTMRAYTVYCHVYGPQAELVTGDCRDGFATTELIAFLYAYSFPKEEWRSRVAEAFHNLELGRR
jgi:hypothetical protein